MANTSYLSDSWKWRATSEKGLIRLCSSVSFCSLLPLIALLLSTHFFGLNVALSQDWSEKDLIKSVHRAEKTFEAGEMSRAYGLFAHLVSVSPERPFLHYRFGAICTHTGTRLEEAEEHLIWANDLGVLDTEHEAGWHYYMGKLRHLQYKFDEAKLLLGNALDLASGREDWLMDAKLRFGQCDDIPVSKESFQSFEIQSSLESHSSDFFRLYQLPQESGRLLVTPESLLSKEDIKRGYTSIMHWLPGQRFAFFSSYGKKGDTGLDVYRVSVSSSGSYGVPEKLPEPVNSDYDDLHPICIPAENTYIDPDLLYFSSSRPESMGGVDIFQVYGLFTGESLGMVARETLEQLPFEINSTHDEWLFWFDESKKKGWLSTNRLKDFEGKEIWQFEWGQHNVIPVSIRIEAANLETGSVLKVLNDNQIESVIEHRLSPDKPWDLVVASGEELHFLWQDLNGTTQKLHLQIPQLNEAHVALESAKLIRLKDGSVGWESFPENFIPQNELSWSNAAREARHRHGTWIFETTDDESHAFREEAESNSGRFISLADNAGVPFYGDSDSLPKWFVDGLRAFEDHSLELDVDDLISSKTARSMALVIQSRMEALFCWAAPGSEGWKAHEAIERIGEPVLASIAQEAYELKGHVKNQALLWDAYRAHIEKSYRLDPTNKAEYLSLKMYLNNHLLAYKGAENQSDDLIRRIEVHLQFERWLSEAFPIDVDDAFHTSLVHLILYEKSVAESLYAVGEALVSNSRPESILPELQSVVWQTIADSIVDVQSLGVFGLPEMEPAQKWFLRSGNLMAEIADGPTHFDAVGKGRRSISLAWDAFQEGKQKRDVVYSDLRISSGEWWEHFGPKETQASGESFEGYELFMKGDAMILEQAKQYQEELDRLRVDSPHSKTGREAVKNAIAIRSNMMSEMESMFGGATGGDDSDRMKVASIRENSGDVSKTGEFVSKKEDIAEAGNGIPNAKERIKERESSNVTSSYSSEKNTETKGFFSVQVGAFRNSPDWSVNMGDLRSKVLDNGLTSYAFGCFETKAEALRAKDAFVGEVPDAFIVECWTDPQEKELDGQINKSSRLPVNPELKNKSSFRVLVASFGATLKPAEVARMLRFGNLCELKSVRLSNSTTYYSEVKDTEEAAQAILDLCRKNGFTQAIIEILD